MSETVVACCQLALEVGQVDENRRAGCAAIADAAGRGAQIVVLPELANSGYVFADVAEALRCAEAAAPGGETVDAWLAAARAHDLVVVGGLCEHDGSDRPRNSAVVVDPDGVRAVYRKVHLWDNEQEIFTPGREAPPVIDTRHGRISVMVCYDLEFPEWVRLPALQGTELLCAPTNWPRESRPADERPAEVVRVQANASVNRMFVAVCDRAGTERGVDWVNGSAIVGPDGYPLAGPVVEDRSATILASCDLRRAREKRIGGRNDVFADRRPGLYADAVR